MGVVFEQIAVAVAELLESKAWGVAGVLDIDCRWNAVGNRIEADGGVWRPVDEEVGGDDEGAALFLGERKEAEGGDLRRFCDGSGL